MPGKRKFTFIVLTTILMLIVSSIAPVRVYADDEIPPPEVTEESAGPSGDSSSEASDAAPVEAPAIQDGANADIPVVDEVATEVPAAAESTDSEASPVATDEASVSDATSDTSSSKGMDVKIVDAQGQAVALDGASADMILDSTPIWCPDGSEPTPGQNGCTASFESMTLLVDYLNTNQPAAEEGTIWIGEGVTPSVDTTVGSELVPQGIEVVIVDEQGQAVPLASQEGVDALLNGEPVWCPEGTTPEADDGNCTASYDSVGLLVSSLADNSQSQDGSIYIQTEMTVTEAVAEMPPATDAGMVTDTVAESPVETAAAADSAVSPAMTELPSVELASVAELTGALDQVTITTALSEATDALLQGTDVVVLDGQGQPMPLTSEEAVNTLINGDPIWCPDGVAPTPGGASGCTPTQSDLAALVSYLASNPQSQSGVIWIEQGNDNSASSIGMDGSMFGNLSSMSTFALTLQGGWSGVSGDTSATGTTIFLQDISIRSWQSNVTLSNIVVQGTFTAGISVDTTGDVVLNNVTSNGNAGSGISVTAANITVNCNNFSDNADYGATFNSPNSVFVNGTTFSNNFSGNYINLGAGIVVEDPSFACGGGGSGSDEKKVTTAEQPSTQVDYVIVYASGDGSTATSELACDQYDGAMLVLSNGDMAVFDCPATGSATVKRVVSTGLPGQLPAGVQFVSAVSTLLNQNGADVRIVAGTVLISFLIPTDMLNSNLVILYWDGSKWLDLSIASFTDGKLVYDGGHKTDDGRFEALTNFTGVFALVKK